MIDVKREQVERYTVTREDRKLDPFRVTIEGNKTDISCWNTTGTAYFNAPGKKGIKHFLTTIGYDYWAKNFFYEKTNNTLNEESTLKALKDKVKRLRLDGSISRKTARELWDYFKKEFCFSNKTECEVWAYERLYHDLGRVISGDSHDLEEVREFFNPWEGGFEIHKTDDPHLFHMWFNGWLPFIENLCNEIGIEYRRPWSPEKPHYIA